MICLQRGRPGFDYWVGNTPWRREKLPIPVFWPGQFHRQRSLSSYNSWGHKESDTTEWLSLPLVPPGKPWSHVWGLLLLLSRFSHVRLCDPRDGRAPGSPVPGILQARTLEWVAFSFSNAWMWKVKVKLLSCVRLLATPWAAAYQAPPSMGFSRQEYKA